MYSQNVSHSVFTFSQSVGSAPTCRLMLSRKMFCKYFLPPFHIVVLSKCVKFHILWHACCHQPQCTKGSFGRTFLRVTQSRWTQKPKNPVPNLQCVYIGLPIYGVLKSNRRLVHEKEKGTRSSFNKCKQFPS